MTNNTPAAATSPVAEPQWFPRPMAMALVFFAGAMAASIALPYLQSFFPRPSIEAPEIIEQTAKRTVVRVPITREGVDLLCTLVIDHNRRTWALSC